MPHMSMLRLLTDPHPLASLAHADWQHESASITHVIMNQGTEVRKATVSSTAQVKFWAEAKMSLFSKGPRWF